MTAPSTEQIETFLNFLEEHRDLARGALRNVEGRLQAQRLWGEICSTLNAMGGCTKTVQQWQRVWTDKKYLAKKNVAAARRSATATGGGPSSAPQLSRWDTKVLSIMGDGFGEPQTTAAVPAFVVSESMPSTHLSQPAPPSPPETQEIREIHTEPLQPTVIGRLTAIPMEQPSTQRSTHSTRERRMRTRTEDSVRSRFFRLEEECVAQGVQWSSELAGIKQALMDMSNGLRQGLHEICVILREIQLNFPQYHFYFITF